MSSTGFHIEENVFSPDECDELIRRMQESSVRRSRAGTRNLMSCACVSEIASDPRLLRITESFSGKALLPYKATLFEKTGKANWLVAWHQDTALPIEEFKPALRWSAPSRKAGTLFAQAPASVLEKVIAIRVHLDDSNGSNGPLRVLPGSHLHGVLGDEELSSIVESVDQVECRVGRGGIIAMSPLLVHASSKCILDEPRRVLHIEYAESLDLSDGIRLAVA